MTTPKTFYPNDRVDMRGGRTGTVIDGPLADWNGAYLVAVDGEGLSYVAPIAMSPTDDTEGATS
jgi:hypothetical protein